MRPQKHVRHLAVDRLACFHVANFRSSSQCSRDSRTVRVRLARSLDAYGSVIYFFFYKKKKRGSNLFLPPPKKARKAIRRSYQQTASKPSTRCRRTTNLPQTSPSRAS